MTTIERDQSSEQTKEIHTENTMDSSNNNLTLPEMTTFDDASPLSPLASLERLVSNPLMRGYSNVSVSSDNEGAHFVPFGRGHDDIANAANGSFSNIDLTQFGFSPNMTGFSINDMNDDSVNCITPVASLLEKNRVPVPPQQLLAPLEDAADTDIDSRTDQTATTSSQDIIPGTQDAAKFNVDAMEFVPSFQAPPSLLTQQAQNPVINIPPARGGGVGVVGMDNDMQPMTVQLPPLLQAVPNDQGILPVNVGPPHPPIMMMGGGGPPPYPAQMVPAPLVMQPVPAQINVDMQPMMDTANQNGVQGSPQQHTPNTPPRPGSGRFRKHSGGSYDGIVRNYMDATGQQNESRSPEMNGGHSPIQHEYGQQQQRWGRQQGGGQQAVQGRGGGGGGNKGYQQGMGRGQGGKSRGGDIGNMEITDIIKMNVSLPTLLDHRMICKFMKHQNGSRYIQERLKNAGNELTMAILRHIIFEEDQILSLSEDIFGNYVIQIFFENGTREQHQLLIENLLYGNVYRLSRSFYGCRVIQKAFDCIPEYESKKLILELENEGKRVNDSENGNGKSLIHECIICPNANHVIQKIITLQLPIENIQFVIDCIDTNICFYSSHIFGCRIVQNIINYYGYHNDKAMLKEMVSKDNLLHLCQSQYGNYVIQHILKLSFFSGKDKCQGIKQQVIKNVFGNVLYLSKNKYGSNVVEHCLEFANDKQRDYFLDQILNKKSRQILCEMVKHKYANYVIQKLLNFCNIKQKQRLIYHIERNVPNLRTLNYGKHIMDKIKKIKQQTGYQGQEPQQSGTGKKYYNNY